MKPFTLSFLVVSSLFVSSLTALTLDEAMKDVVESNPEVQERIHDFRAIYQDKNIAFAGFLPTLDFVAAAGREKTNNNTTNFQDRYLNRTEMAIILNLNLYRGNWDKFNMTRQENRLKSASYRVAEVINTKTLETAQTYLALLKQHKILQLAEENVKTHEELYNQIEQRISEGVGAQSEQEQAASRLALAQSNLMVTQNNFYDAISNFEKVYGQKIDASELQEPVLDYEFLESLDALVQKGQDENPSLATQRANVEVANTNYKMTQQAYLPTVDLVARKDWNEDVGGLDADDDSSSIMLQFRYNLFNGGADKATRQKRVSELAKEKRVLETMKRQNKERIALAWNAYNTLGKQIGFLEKHRDLSKNTLDLYTEEFSLGRRTLLDILDTEGEYYSAKRELTIANYDRLFAEYRILETMGTLMSVVGEPALEMVGIAKSGVSKADKIDTIE